MERNKKRQIKKKVEETFGCHSSDLSRSSSSQQELGRRPPRLLLLCAYHLHAFLPGWRGLALIKASSRVFPPRIPAAMNPYLPWRWWPLTVVRRHSKETRWRQGGQRDVLEERPIVSVQGKQKRTQRRGRKIWERINESSVCGSLAPSLHFCASLSVFLTPEPGSILC